MLVYVLKTYFPNTTDEDVDVFTTRELAVAQAAAYAEMVEDEWDGSDKLRRKVGEMFDGRNRVELRNVYLEIAECRLDNKED